MRLIFNGLLIISLFIILGFGADLAVRHIKYIATALRIRLFAFGVILGLITTLPELSVGINSILTGVGSLSVGNLLGGIIVIFGFILGSSLILNRIVETDGLVGPILPQLVLIILPIFLGLDGHFGLIDGLILIVCYLSVLYFLYRYHRGFSLSIIEVIDKNRMSRAIIFSLVGIIVVLLSSHWIVELTNHILKEFNISGLFVGAIFFSIGTNLPEIIITITSWRKRAAELSLSHLLSSSFTNVMVLGVLSLLKPIVFNVDVNYWLIVLFLVFVCSSFLLFYWTEKRLERREGAFLLVVYLIFLLSNLWFTLPSKI